MTRPFPVLEGLGTRMFKFPMERARVLPKNRSVSAGFQQPDSNVFRSAPQHGPLHTPAELDASDSETGRYFARADVVGVIAVLSSQTNHATSNNIKD